jgi:MoxR-like ATPase
VASTPSLAPESGSLELSADQIGELERNVLQVFRGKREVIRLAIVTLLARGHLLIEDVPGVGKTTLAQALARSLGLSFQRIQCTSDLLPSDILGVTIWNQREQRFEFVPGPIFASILLVDEINRATPKTQSALLEAMSEGRVTVERRTYDLPKPFLVLATQNPQEHSGTFFLPESQLDRFLLHLRLGYPDRANERELILSGGVEEELANLRPVWSAHQLIELQNRVRSVHVAESIGDYILALVEATRRSDALRLGVSTRAALGICRAAQALALCEGRTFVVPDDVKALFLPVLAHRVVLRRGSGDLDQATAVLQRILDTTPVPI